MPATESWTVWSVANVEPEPVLTVTVAVPPSSSIAEALTDSMSDGAASLSSMSSASPPGGVTDRPEAVVEPLTVRLSPGSSMRSFAGVSVKRAVAPTA